MSEARTERNLEGLVGELATACGQRRLTLATAESCTGGWVAKTCTDLPGSSGWFLGGVVAYSDTAKRDLLGVAPAVLESEGAVSEPVVRAMAERARRAFGADLAVAVSGVAGPDGGSDAKPVGTVWFAWASSRGVETHCEQFDGDREAVRRTSVVLALEGLRRLALATPA